jgi:hypothetical protein
MICFCNMFLIKVWQSSSSCALYCKLQSLQYSGYYASMTLSHPLGALVVFFKCVYTSSFAWSLGFLG